MMAHPDALRELIARYHDLAHCTRHRDDDRHLQAVDDLTYTLCISTGTRTLSDALNAAHAHIATHSGCEPSA